MLRLGDCATYPRVRSRASRIFVWRNREKSRHDVISRVALRKKEEEKHGQVRESYFVSARNPNSPRNRNIRSYEPSLSVGRKMEEQGGGD